jgi:Na+-driven multidrug efflux pump
MSGYVRIKEKFFAAWRSYPREFMGLMVLAWAIPAIYSLINTYYIGQMEMEAIAISEQYEFIVVLLEILLEMFPIAVLALVAHHFTDSHNASDVIRAALPMQLMVTIGFTLLGLFGANLFVDAMNVPPEIASRTEAFLRVKALAIPFESMAALFIISIRAMRRGRLALLVAATGVIINVVLDTMMISDLPFSLKLGIMGSAWDYVISKVLIFAVAIIVFYLIVKKRPSIRFDRKMCEAIFRIGKYTGLESAVRNAGYILGMLIVLNTLGTA